MDLRGFFYLQLIHRDITKSTVTPHLSIICPEVVDNVDDDQAAEAIEANNAFMDADKTSL
jgi:hypothetical protein